jgi:hypothetical protein
MPSTRALSVVRWARLLVNSTRNFSSSRGHPVIHELRAVVGVKTQYPKRNLMQHGLQNGEQKLLADLAAATHHLPLRNRIHTVDVVYPLAPSQSP